MSLPRLNPADYGAWDRLQRPIWVFDPRTHRGLYANPAAVALWGAESRAELLSRDFSQLSPAIRTRTNRIAAEAAGGAVLNERWSFYPSGEPTTVQLAISGLAQDDGSVALLFEAAPVAVAAEELRAVEALRHTDSMITLFDGEGRPLFSNPAAFVAYGRESDRFVGRFASPREGAEALARVLGGEILSSLREVGGETGPRWRVQDARRVLDPASGAAGALVSERDVTDQVEAERALQAAQQRAEAAEAKHRFLTTVSHEFRTPLNAVIGFADLLAATELGGAQSGHLDRIREAGAQLTRTLNHMIEVADMDGADGDVPARPAEPAVEEEAPDQGAADLSVLYADDNEANRTLVQAILGSQGARCDLVCDGAEAVAAVRGGDYDLVLMDIQMPVMDGVTAARAIRALPTPAGAVPILALTANTLAGQLQTYAAAGMQDCIAKPVNMAEIIAKTAHWANVGRDARRQPAPEPGQAAAAG